MKQITCHHSFLGFTFFVVNKALCFCACLLFFTPHALAQDLPSLDELLDLDVPKTQKQPVIEDQPIDPDELSPAGGRDAMQRAVNNMHKVAKRMGDNRDVSLSLQRLQEEIIKDLDQVIASAKKQKQKSSSSSSSSSSGSPSEDQQKQSSTKSNSSERSDAQKGNAQPQSSSQKTSAKDGNPADIAAKMAAQKPGDVARPLESSKVEWGNLPPRLRDELMQGTQERFSPVYEKQTQAYYRRLAEEAK
ncbi:MAG: hypothetical protein JKX85_03560 [Phycisphaeraceae bacterium]|nr:hypothetical protein [Phycisphaeraceae bacterium]